MMMKAGEPRRPTPTVEIPPCDFEYPLSDVQTHNIYTYESAMAAFQRYLPSNNDDVLDGLDEDSDDFQVPVDSFSCDNFRMFEFKVRKCLRARSHDWTECPFAHPGEKARRRDPRKCHYSGTPCPDFRKGSCQRGDACDYAHGVFECWLHPARYRTQPCKDGTRCRRRVCFFAHSPEKLRILPYATSPDASPSRLSGDSFVASSLFGSSPKSGSYSPPVSPTTLSTPSARGGLMGINSVDQLAESMHGLQVNNMKMGLGLGMSPPSWRRAEFGSSRSPTMIRPGFNTLPMPSTPILRSRAALKHARLWETSCQEEPRMEEFTQYRVGLVDFPDKDPDVGWVYELIE